MEKVTYKLRSQVASSGLISCRCICLKKIPNPFIPLPQSSMKGFVGVFFNYFFSNSASHVASIDFVY